MPQLIDPISINYQEKMKLEHYLQAKSWKGPRRIIVFSRRMMTAQILQWQSQTYILRAPNKN